MMIEPLDDGGIAHYAFNLLNALVKKITKIVLVTGRDYELRNMVSDFKIYPVMFCIASYVIKLIPWLSKETRYPSLIRRSLKLLEYPLNMIVALAIAKKQKIDIVHIQTVNLIELLMVAGSKLVGMKVVFTIHNVLPRHQRLRFYHPVFYRILYFLCDHIIIHSENGRKEVIKLFSVSPRKISVINHGNYSFFVPDSSMSVDHAKASLGILKGCKTILFFGAIRPNKGLDNLLYAVSRIKKTFSDIKLIIAGEPCENYMKYRNIIEEKGLRDHVIERLDYIPNQEISRYFEASDLVVLPYNEVTQSGVLQVAYAFGKPVVATSVGGLNEAVENSKSGFLVPPNDIKALAEKIVAILQDEEGMERMGRYSRLLSDTKYSWDTIASQTLDIYSKFRLAS